MKMASITAINSMCSINIEDVSDDLSENIDLIVIVRKTKDFDMDNMLIRFVV